MFSHVLPSSVLFRRPFARVLSHALCPRDLLSCDLTVNQFAKVLFANFLLLCTNAQSLPVFSAKHAFGY